MPKFYLNLVTSKGYSTNFLLTKSRNAYEKKTSAYLMNYEFWK